MRRLLIVCTVAALTCSIESLANAAERGGGAAKSPGGSWSDRSHQGGQSSAQHEYPQGAAGGFRSPASSERNPSAAEGAAAKNLRSPSPSGKEDAAAGAAAENRRTPTPSGKEDAAAGAAASNRNSPQVSGAQGAAAGAAAANRNNPSLTGAQGAAVGAAAANRNNPTLSGAQGAAVGAAAVRNSFNNYGLYGQSWQAANAAAWAPAQWTAGTAWTPANASAVAGYIGAANTPVWYDFGVNVTCQDGNVAMNGQPVGTAEQFSQQAADLAASGAKAAGDEWLPLGVFAMVRNEQQHPQLVFQLAVNKQGVLRGNYTDELTEHTQPITGAVDPKSQRAAWTVGDNKTTVIEAGISNLTDGEASALIHNRPLAPGKARTTCGAGQVIGIIRSLSNSTGMTRQGQFPPTTLRCI